MTRAKDSDDDCCCKKKCGEEEEEEELTREGPPDGGWGWMVVLASLTCNMIVDGVLYTMSTFNDEIQDHFKCGTPAVALLTSLPAGCYLIVGPLVSALATRYNCRKVTIAGAVLASLSFAIGTQSSSIEMLIVCVGVFGGIGFGMIYLPAIVTVGLWFEKKRAFATGIAVCGTGLGMFVIAPFGTYLVEEYGWQGGLLLISGLILNCAVCGALFRPIDKKIRRIRPIVEIQRGSIMKALIEEKKRQRTISNGSLDNCIITKDNRLIKIDPSFFEAKRNNSFIARFKESLGFSTKSLDKSKQSLAVPSIKIDQVSNGASQNLSPIYKPSAKNSHSSLSTSSDSGCNVSPDMVLTAKSCEVLPTTDPWKKSSMLPDLPVCSRSFQALNCSIPAGLGTSVISIQVVQSVPSTRTRHRASRSSSSRSLAMTDSGTLHPPSFVSGSMLSIPQCSVQTIEHYEGEPSALKKIFCLIRDMFDFHLMKSRVFALLLFASILSMLAFFVPFVFIQKKAQMVGSSPSAGNLLISIIGITNCIGRIISGWIADRPWTDALHLNNFALIFAGIATFLVPFCQSYTALAIYGAVFGMCIAVFVSLRSILLVELIGLELLTKSFGILILFQGVAVMCGPPLTGKLMDIEGSVNLCFYLAGALLLLSGLVGLPLRRVKQWEEGKIPAPLPEEMPITETYKLEVESTM